MVSVRRAGERLYPGIKFYSYKVVKIIERGSEFIYIVGKKEGGMAQKFLGEFEQMVLLALLKLGDQAYGASIRQLLDQQVGRDVALGALYSTLERLEKKAMVTSRMGEATPQRGGRPKRYFDVTAKGVQALKEVRQAMNTLWQDVSICSGVCAYA